MKLSVLPFSVTVSVLPVTMAPLPAAVEKARPCRSSASLKPKLASVSAKVPPDAGCAAADSASVAGVFSVPANVTVPVPRPDPPAALPCARRRPPSPRCKTRRKHAPALRGRPPIPWCGAPIPPSAGAGSLRMSVPDRPASPCPICGKPAAPAQSPFCGTRCADVDLGRWLTGQYRVPGPAVDGREDEASALERNRDA